MVVLPWVAQDVATTLSVFLWRSIGVDSECPHYKSQGQICPITGRQAAREAGVGLTPEQGQTCPATVGNNMRLFFEGAWRRRGWIMAAAVGYTVS